MADANVNCADGGEPAVPPATPLEILQQRYALIKLGGRVWVLDGLRGAASGQETMQKQVFFNRSDASLLMKRTLSKIDPRVDAEPVVQDFFIHRKTICFEGLEFNPAGTTLNYLNVWVGPTIQPKPGKWSRIEAFLKLVICSNADDYYNYLLGYIAHALQRPGEKPGITIILVGGQGIGKGTLGRILRRIWQRSYLQVNRTANVTGSFNADLERAFIVFLDEALFAGDRASSDALKSLVTEDVIQINEKHQPSRQIRSYHRFLIATNADHVKHTDRDDRRDFVLRVSEAHKGDHDYWQALNLEIDGDGVAAMVHDLLAMDLSGFNVRAKPQTSEFMEQKLRSLDPVERYWYEVLQGEHKLGDIWPDFIPTGSLIDGVVELSGKRLYRQPSAREIVNVILKMCPSARKGQKQEHLERARGLYLPELSVARAEFEAYVGGSVSWE